MDMGITNYICYCFPFIKGLCIDDSLLDAFVEHCVVIHSVNAYCPSTLSKLALSNWYMICLHLRLLITFSASFVVMALLIEFVIQPISMNDSYLYI
uniref:Uncharacterized protein n=1 Tax=Arundo donax TaxID=35708 RepID=A0A0A9HES3_ARUDO